MLVEKLYTIRDHYWQEGGVPEDQKPLLRRELDANFRQEGLERTLLEIGLNPLDAALDHNGAGGAFAKWMGAKDTVNQTIGEYKNKVAIRIERLTSEAKPDTNIRKPQYEEQRLVPSDVAATVHV